MRKLWRTLRWVVGLLAVLAIVAGVVLASLDLDEYRPRIEAELGAALGRKVEVTGGVGLGFSLTPTIAVTGLRIGNIEGAGEPWMATVARVDVAADLLALLGGTVALGRIEIEDAEVHLEELEDGRASWQITPAGDGAATAEPGSGADVDLAIGALEVRRVRLSLLRGGVREEVWIERLEADLSEASVASIELDGTVRGLPVSLVGVMPGLAILQGGGPAPVALKGKLRDTRFSLDGELARPAALDGLRLQAQAEDDDIARLAEAFAAAVPVRGGVRLQASITGSVLRPAAEEVVVVLRAGGADYLTLTGGVADLAAQTGIDFDLRLASAKPSDWLADLPPDLPLRDLKARGRLTGSLDRLALRLDEGSAALGEGLALAFSGAFDDALALRGPGFVLEATGEDVRRLASLLPADAKAGIPDLGGLSAKARLVLADGRFDAEEITGEIGAGRALGVRFEGVVRDLAGAPQVDLAISSAVDDLKALAPLLPKDLHGQLPALGAIKASGRLAGDLSMLELRDVKAGARLQDLRLSAVGTVRNLTGAPELDIVARARGDSLRALEPLAGRELPPAGPFVASVQVAGTPQSLLLRDPDVRFGAEGGVVLQVPGEIRDPASHFQAPFPVHLTMKNTAQLTPLLGVEIPAYGRLEMQAIVSGAGEAWRAEDISLRVGDTTLTGRLEADLEPGRPRIEATVTSDFVNLETFSDPDRPENRAPDPFVFDEDPLPIAALGGFDLEADVAIAQLVSNKVLVRDLKAKLVVINGRATIEDATARLGGGPARFNLMLDGIANPPRLEADWQLDDGNMGQMLQRLFGSDEVTGKVQARGRIAGVGGSLRAIASRADGRVELVVSEGRLKTSALELIAADLLSELNFLKKKTEYANLNCLAAAFDVKQGIATPQVMLLDSDRMVMTGEGTIDLRSEALKLTLKPRPKDPSLLSLATPIDVRGTLADPRFTPSATGLLGSAALAILGNLVLPGAGLLLPLLSGGAGNNHPCLKVSSPAAQ